VSQSCDDGESVDNYQSGHVTARVAHTCHCCPETIRPGDIHFRASWVYEGRYDSFRRCARCHLLYLELVKLHRKHDIRDEFGDLMGVDPELNCGHSFEKVFGREPPEELARLAFMTPAEVQALLAGATP
jgi:hypothetical protein